MVRFIVPTGKDLQVIYTSNSKSADLPGRHWILNLVGNQGRKASQSKESYLSNSSDMPIPEKVVVTSGVSLFWRSPAWQSGMDQSWMTLPYSPDG